MGKFHGKPPPKRPTRLARFWGWLSYETPWENPEIPARAPHEDVEAYKTRLAHWELRWRFYFDWHIESFKLMGVFAQNATRAVFLLNGGALVVLLGAAWKESGAGEPLFLPADIREAGTYFFAGLMLSVLVSGFSYLAQHEFTRHWNRMGIGFQLLGIACFILSWGAFLAGAVCARSGMNTH